ncbi:hypothetical protein AGMMS50262_16000 [Bacteroidia bacterium]|nr:hypothetical protein AGMMS50262_16000 [Bacteroidia bacterium]
MAGIGSSSVYDSYLSPLEYKGYNFGLIYEEMSQTKILKGNVFAQHLFQLEVSDTRNPAETAENYTGWLNYDYGLFYRFKPVQKFQFFAGVQAGGLLGFVYSLRNVNNPVSVKAYINLNVSGMAVYSFQIKKQPVRLRYQVNVPAMGVLFSPHFGQSYYEIGLGDNADLVYFASFHNQWTVRNLLSVELPFKTFTLRLAYLNNLYETRQNQLQTHLSSSSFYIGLSKQFFIVSERKPNNNFINVFD